MGDTLPAFALTALAVELTPGPNMAYLAMLGLSRGRQAGLAAVAGVALGLLGLGLVAGPGVGTVLLESPGGARVLRWAGAGYFVWLAVDAVRDARRPLGGFDASLPLGVYARRGLLSNLLNPKAAVFFVSVLPEFASAGAPAQLALLVGVYVAIATAVHAAIVLVAERLSPLLIQPARRRASAWVFVGVLLLLAGWFVLADRL